MLLCLCVSPSQLLDVIQSGTLLCGVTTLNSAPIPSSTRNRNSTRVGAHTMKEEEYKIIVNLIRNDGKFHIPKNVKTSVHRSAYVKYWRLKKDLSQKLSSECVL